MTHYPQVYFNNQITYSLGFKISIMQLPQQQNIEFVDGSSDDKFVGLFPCSDTDFGIVIDNSDNLRRISVNLKGTKDFGSFIVGARKTSVLKTVTNNGRHFHFTSQLSEEGKELVAGHAVRSNITFGESSELCSELLFNVDIEDYKKFTIKGKTTKEHFEITVDPHVTIATLRKLIEAKIGFPADQQQLMVCGKRTFYCLKQCEDDRTVEDHGLRYYNTLYVGGLRGGGCAPKETDNMKLASMPKTLGHKVAKTNDGIAGTERGAICFGRKTDQTFKKYDDFKKSDTDNLKPFKLELRFKPKLYLDP